MPAMAYFPLRFGITSPPAPLLRGEGRSLTCACKAPAPHWPGSAGVWGRFLRQTVLEPPYDHGHRRGDDAEVTLAREDLLRNRIPERAHPLDERGCELRMDQRV